MCVFIPEGASQCFTALKGLTWVVSYSKMCMFWFCSTSSPRWRYSLPYVWTRPNIVHTNPIFNVPALQLGLILLVELLVGEVAGRKSHLSALSATQVEANKMWTKLNFSINGIIPRLMCRLLEQNMRSAQGQPLDVGWQTTWARHSIHSHG